MVERWHRRGQDWEVFNQDPPGVGGEIQAFDEEPWYDDDANAYVLMTATNDDAPDEIVLECREAILEIARGWPQPLCPPGIDVAVDSAGTTHDLVARVLDQAATRPGAERVPYHLVAALLELRFKSLNLSVGSDEGSRDPWQPLPDLLVGDTVFHPAAAPTDWILDRCRVSSELGRRVSLLIRDAQVREARALLASLGIGPITVESIESFVSQMLESTALYSLNARNDALLALVRAYNRRIRVTEGGSSLMLDVHAG
jgi:hypothetical protein